MLLSSVRSSRVVPFVLASAALVTIVALNRRTLCRVLFRAKRQLSAKEVCVILEKLMDGFFPVLFETGQTSQRAQILAARRQTVPKQDEDLVASVLMDGGVGARLEQLQSAVLYQADVTEEEFVEAVAMYCEKEDETVSRLSEALDTMVGNFLQGGLPVHGNAEILSQERTLMLLEESMRRKSAAMAVVFKEWQQALENALPSGDHAKIMAAQCATIEEDLCREESVRLLDFQSSIAQHTNSSDSFRKTLMTLLMQFQSLPSSY